MTTRFAPAPTGLARPGRRVVVIDDLHELHGPTSGIVELPHRLFWYPERTFNLNDTASLAWLYQIVLRESVSREELRTWLHGPRLLTLWPSLFLPQGVRSAWELRHPELKD